MSNSTCMMRLAIVALLILCVPENVRAQSAHPDPAMPPLAPPIGRPHLKGGVGTTEHAVAAGNTEHAVAAGNTEHAVAASTAPRKAAVTDKEVSDDAEIDAINAQAQKETLSPQEQAAIDAARQKEKTKELKRKALSTCCVWGIRIGRQAGRTALNMALRGGW